MSCPQLIAADDFIGNLEPPFTSCRLTFLLMVSEMATFCLLVLPLPFTVRKKLFTFLSENPLVAKVRVLALAPS